MFHKRINAPKEIRQNIKPCLPRFPKFANLFIKKILPAEIFMRKNLYVIYSLFLLTGIACLFAPFLYLDNQYVSFIDIVVNYQINGYFAFVFVAFASYFIGIILSYFIDKNKWISVIAISLTIISALLFSFSKTICGNAVNYSSMSLSVSPIVLAVLSICATLYLNSKIFDNYQLNIHDIAEIAIFVSFAFLFDLPFFKIKIVANGGSISLIMLPLILLSLRKGFIKGFIACGIVFGLISCFLDGYGLITYPLDYLLGFGAMAIVGLFRKYIINPDKKITYQNYLWLFIGTLLAMVVRTLTSTLSGIVIYKLDFVSSLVYQLTYMGPSFLVVMALLLILLYPLNRLEKTKIE